MGISVLQLWAAVEVVFRAISAVSGGGRKAVVGRVWRSGKLAVELDLEAKVLYIMWLSRKATQQAF